MMNLMLCGIALLALVMNSNPARAEEDDWDSHANIADAASVVLRALDDDRASMGKQADACYEEARKAKSMKRLEYCLAYDAAAFKLLGGIAKQNNNAPPPAFTFDVYDKRTRRNMTIAGVEPERQTQAREEITEAAGAAVRKIVAERVTAKASTSKQEPSSGITLFPAEAPSQAFASQQDMMREAQCVGDTDTSWQAKALFGQFGGLDMTEPMKTRRQCAMIALCDTLDGRPNMLRYVGQLGGSERQMLAECRGVDVYGPNMIANEPVAFNEVHELMKQLKAKR